VHRAEVERDGQAVERRRAITRADEIAPTPSAVYSGSQWAEPFVKSIGSPRELIGLKMKTSLRFVVREAMNPLVKLSAGPASEKWSVIVPVNVPGSPMLFEARNALL
jgi:hypothetical protein